MDDDRRAAERAEDAALVARARGEDPDAFGRLYDRWFDRAHDLAFRIVRDDSAAADVAQDAFVSAWKNLGKLEKPDAFGGWLLRITRNGALDRKRRDARATPVDDEGIAMIEASGPSPASAPAGFRVEDRTRESDDPARAAEDNELATLVWESAAALGERDAEILDLGLRHGLTPAEVGEVIGMNRNAANQAVHRVRNRLKVAVEARVLWRSGEPVCTGLSDSLEAAGVKRFGADAVRVATEHAASCAECQQRRQLRLEPSKMFAALPILSIPMLKSKIAHALDMSDVPMGESEALLIEVEPEIVDGRRHPRARQLLAGGVGLVVVVFTVGAFAEDVDAPVTRNALSTRVTTTTKAGDLTTTTIAVPGATDDPGASTTSTTKVAVPGGFPLPGDPTSNPGGPPPGPTPPVPPPAPAATISGPARTSTESPYTITWSSSGADSVSVTGPGLSSGQPSGSLTRCNTGIPTACRNDAGPQTYTITAVNAGGTTTRSVTVYVA